MMPDCLPKLAVPMSTEADPSSGPCGWVDSSEEECHLGARSLALQSARWRAHSATNLMGTLCSSLCVNRSCLQYSLLDFSKLRLLLLLPYAQAK